jgi:aromatic ring-cleaving dioxygenase
MLTYHAHVYFRSTRERGEALILRSAVSRRFVLELGSIHDEPIGPHLTPMWEAAFTPECFGDFVSWLMLNRNGLSVLIHPNTGKEMDDHVLHAFWLGTPLSLFTGALTADAEIEPVNPNTIPTQEFSQ